MRARLRNNYDDSYSITVTLPVRPTELYDILDRLGTDNKWDNAYMNIEDEYIPEAMREGGFYDDIFKLNILAQRIEELSPSGKAGFTAVLQEHEDFNLDDILLVTYSMDAYPIYPCSSYAELGEIIIENDMIAEVENCPDELIKYLDKEAIGRLAAERSGGIFTGGYYCEVADYEPPDMEISIGKPPRNEFRLLVGNDEKTAQWMTLPCTEDISHSNIYCVDSPLPNIKTVYNISKLNETAKIVSELDNSELVKLKAIMESDGLRGAEGALKAYAELDERELDASVKYYKDYGMKYLSRQLPEDFDMSLLDSDHLCTTGRNILENKDGTITSYGVLSGIEQELYSALTVQEDEQEMELMQ